MLFNQAKLPPTNRRGQLACCQSLVEMRGANMATGHDLTSVARTATAAIEQLVSNPQTSRGPTSRALVVAPQGRERTGWQRQPYGDRALLSGGTLFAALAQHRTSQPGTGTLGEPGLIGIGSRPRRFAAIGQPVSSCHQWSTTGPEGVGGPVVRVGVELLAGYEQLRRVDR